MNDRLSGAVTSEHAIQQGWIDVHTHLNFLDHSPEEALSLAQEAGVSHVVTIGTEPEDWPVVLELSQRFAPSVFCTLGLHPHEAQKWNNDLKQFVRENASHSRVVALGEMGLDYYYSHAPHDVQKEVFEDQLRLAVELDLPVEIHTRDADEDTVEILKKFKGQATGLIHCFTGSEYLAQECLNLGFYLSFSGVMTFKNADNLRKIVTETPIDRLFVETDAPFLAPVPHRGKKNTPAYVVATAQKVAELKGVTLEKLQKQTVLNAQTLFKRLAVPGF